MPDDWSETITRFLRRNTGQHAGPVHRTTLFAPGAEPSPLDQLQGPPSPDPNAPPAPAPAEGGQGWMEAVMRFLQRGSAEGKRQRGLDQNVDMIGSGREEGF